MWRFKYGGRRRNVIACDHKGLVLHMWSYRIWRFKYGGRRPNVVACDHKGSVLHMWSLKEAVACDDSDMEAERENAPPYVKLKESLRMWRSRYDGRLKEVLRMSRFKYGGRRTNVVACDHKGSVLHITRTTITNELNSVHKQHIRFRNWYPCRWISRGCCKTLTWDALISTVDWRSNTSNKSYSHEDNNYQWIILGA